MTEQTPTVEADPSETCPWCGEPDFCERCGDCRGCPVGCLCDDEPEGYVPRF